MNATLKEIDRRNAQRRREDGRMPETDDEPGTQPYVDTIADRADTGADADTAEYIVAPFAWAIGRLTIGFVFLWAFFDKLLALGYATGAERDTGAIDRFGDAARINGDHPPPASSPA
jgi:hypothetical protein